MWLRFQIGSKRPLAKRRARMFCAASLPRKWSMRKTCSSSKTSWTIGVQLPGAREVGAERLLHDHPRALGQPGVAEHPHRRRVAGGRRDAQVVQAAAASPPELALGAAPTASAERGRRRARGRRR